MRQNAKYLSLLGVWFPLFFIFIKFTPTLAQTKLPIQSVTASSFQAPNEPPNTVDGSLGTRWSAEGDGEWIQYDLGSPQMVSQVFIAWYLSDRQKARFVIEISLDGLTWTQVFSGRNTDDTLGLQPYGFADVLAHYLRFVGFGTDVNEWNSITEVEIHGPNTNGNILPVQSVTASDFHDTNIPTNTLDGDLGTRWSAEGDGEWIQYDLGTPQAIDKVLIAWFRGDLQIARFDLEVSSDASQWRQVFSGVSRSSLTFQEYEFIDATALYLRILGHGSNLNAWNSITEIEIHGPSGAPGSSVDLIGIVPDTFSTDGGTFKLSIIPRDDQSNPITSGVTRDNFTFRDITVSFEATPQEIVTNGRANVTNVQIVETGPGEQLTLILDFDGSGSMLENDPNRLRVVAGQQLISLLKSTDRAAIMDFGEGTDPGLRASRIIQNFTSDKMLLNTAIDGLTASLSSQGTPMFDSLLDTLDVLASEAAPNPAIVLLTDGEDNTSSSTDTEVISRAQERGVPIFAIGLGGGVGFPPLQAITGGTGGTFAEAVNADELARIFEAIGVGIVDGRVIVTGEGRFDPPLANTGTYIVSGALVTTLGGQSFNTPFSFPVEVEEPDSSPPPPPPPPPPSPQSMSGRVD